MIVVPSVCRSQDDADRIARCINSCRYYEPNTPIITVDDHSSFPYTRGEYHIKRIGLSGVAPSWNKGIQEAWSRGATHVFVINDDVELIEPVLESLIDVCDGDIGVVGPATTHLARKHPRIREDMRWFPGWAFLLPKHTWDQVGSFDETLRPAFWEDGEYWLRVHKHNLALLRNETVAVAHLESQTVKSLEAEKLKEQNLVKVVAKHGIPVHELMEMFYG